MRRGPTFLRIYLGASRVIVFFIFGKRLIKHSYNILIYSETGFIGNIQVRSLVRKALGTSASSSVDVAECFCVTTKLFSNDVWI